MCLTREKIIHNLFTGKNFNQCLSKMEPECLREDLRQEVILIVCELPEPRLSAMHQAGTLEFFTVRVILNQIKSKTSPFYKKFRQFQSEYNENLADDERRELKRGTELSMTEEKHLENRHFKIYTSEVIDFKERQLKEDFEDFTVAQIDTLHWYNRGLIELYIKHGNFRAIEEVTGIPYGSAYKTIRRSLDEIRLKVTL